MQVIFLGTGTIYPDPERRSPGLVLKDGKKIMVFDSGPGTWFRLSEAGLDFRKVSTLFYSHVHLDHILDYPAYLFLTHNPEFKRKAPLEVFAPRIFQKFDNTLKKMFGTWMSPFDQPVNIHPLPRKKAVSKLGDLKVTSGPVKHTDVSLAFRIDKGKKSFVYSGDVEYCREIVKLAEGADLLVTECAHPEGKKMPGHLVPSEAGRIARAAGVKKLALTHFYPDCKGKDMITPAQKEFDGEVIIATDLMKLQV